MPKKSQDDAIPGIKGSKFDLPMPGKPSVKKSGKSSSPGDNSGRKQVTEPKGDKLNILRPEYNE